MQLATEAAQKIPASVLTHCDWSSLAPPQHDGGEHTVHEHMTLCEMLNPGRGGG